VGTQKDNQTGERKNPGKYKVKSGRQIRQMMMKYDADRTKVGKLVNPRCREKPLLRILYPYRKPTQVDEERILRPTREVLLRNSAK